MVPPSNFLFEEEAKLIPGLGNYTPREPGMWWEYLKREARRCVYIEAAADVYVLPIYTVPSECFSAVQNSRDAFWFEVEMFSYKNFFTLRSF